MHKWYVTTFKGETADRSNTQILRSRLPRYFVADEESIEVCPCNDVAKGRYECRSRLRYGANDESRELASYCINSLIDVGYCKEAGSDESLMIMIASRECREA